MAGVVGTERKTGPFTVFTDLELVKSYVTRSEFSFTEDIDSADIIWTASHFRKFGSAVITCLLFCILYLCICCTFRDLEQSTNQFINQFPFESIITCKDLLARICQEGNSFHDMQLLLLSIGIFALLVSNGYGRAC